MQKKQPKHKVHEFWGVDQTGATVDRGQTAKRLSAARLVINGPKWELGFYSLAHALDVFDESKTRSPWVGVDAVLGIPTACSHLFSSLRKEFKRAHQFRFGGKRYGRDVGQAFFVRESLGQVVPRRHCEQLSGSNSVLTHRPAQRNIQTGSYRIWSDLGAPGAPSFRIWPFETPLPSQTTEEPVVFEVYPSLYWKSLFSVASRKPAELVRLARARFPGLKLPPPPSDDHADAAVSALAMAEFYSQNQCLPQCPLEAREVEGWIFGLSS